MGWKIRLDVDKDDGTEPPSRWRAALAVVAVTGWIVLIAVVAAWVERLVLR